jgi:hypothetical protein
MQLGDSQVVLLLLFCRMGIKIDVTTIIPAYRDLVLSHF